MSTPCQKQICGAMHRLLNGAVLTIGPFSQLDFATAAEIKNLNENCFQNYQINMNK